MLLLKVIVISFVFFVNYLASVRSYDINASYLAAIDIWDETYKSFCAGSFITREFVVTAASCVYGKKGIIVSPASSVSNPEHRTNFYVSNVYVHDNFSVLLGTNDIALLKLYKMVDLAEDVSPLLLLPQTNGGMPYQMGLLSGWGFQVSGAPDLNGTLEDEVRFDIQEYCLNWNANQSRLVCDMTKWVASIGLKRAVVDKGGPLVSYDNLGRKALLGIGTQFVPLVLWPTEMMSFVFTRVTHYTDWISGIVPDIVAD